MLCLKCYYNPIGSHWIMLKCFIFSNKSVKTRNGNDLYYEKIPNKNSCQILLGEILKSQSAYFTVSNNHAAKFIIFLKKSNLHTLIPSCTFINFWNFWSKTFIFTNEKRKKSNLHALIPSCMFISFLKFCHPALLFHPA